jgi:hypothetical protein
MPDRNIPWRQLGATTRAGWRAWLKKRGSPYLPIADALYDAAKPHHKLFAGMIWAECQAGRDMPINKPESNNPMNHRNVDNPAWYYGGEPGPVGYMHYDSVPDCFRATIKRLTDPAYKNGVYQGRDTLYEMISTYAPASDGNDPYNYCDTVLFIASELPDAAGQPDTPPTGKRLTWRDVAKRDLRITQPFGDPSPDQYGWRYGVPNGTHVGLDIGMPRGTEIVALVDGVVEEVVLLAPYYRPNYVVIRRPNGHRILHAHMWTVTVKEGQTVRWDTPIGTSGEQTYAIKDRNGNQTDARPVFDQRPRSARRTARHRLPDPHRRGARRQVRPDEIHPRRQGAVSSALGAARHRQPQKRERMERSAVLRPRRARRERGAAQG